MVARVWPKATMIPNKHGDTPLHIATRVSQQSSGRVSFLADLNEEALLVRNVVGQTPLGTACISGAWLRVLALLVEKCPKALLMEDEYGQTPVVLLWSSFLKTVPGALSIRTYERDGGDMPNLLDRFW